MGIDLKKYDNIIFHEDEELNKRIKTYMVIFDYQCLIGNFNDEDKVKKLLDWEQVFLKEEFYEIIPSLIHRRGKIEKRLKHDSLSFISQMAYKLSDILQSIINNKSKNK